MTIEDMDSIEAQQELDWLDSDGSAIVCSKSAFPQATIHSYKPDITVIQILAHFTPDYKSVDAPNALLLTNILHHPNQLRSI